METNLKKYELFSELECQSIISDVNKDDKVWYKTFRPTVLTTSLNENLWYSKKITNWISEHFNLNESKLKLGFDGTCFKYFPNSFFHEHTDVLNHNKSYPLYNINVILNNDFEGGNFFLNRIEYESIPGFIYKYKSNEKHGVKMVTSGIRYVLVYHVFDTDLKITQKNYI